MTDLLALVSPTVYIIGFRLIVSALLLAVQAYVLRAILRIIRSMGLDERKEKAMAAAAIALIALLNAPLAVFMVEGIFSPRQVMLYTPPAEYESLMRPMAYTFFIWTLGSLFFAAAAPAAMAAFAAAQFFRRKRAGDTAEATVQPFDLSRRRFLQLALTAAAAMPFAISAYGAIAARSRRVVERVVIPIRGLAPQLDGLTIAQMSDIHAGLFMTERQMREAVEIANSLEPDVVALTGDYVATNNNQVAPFISAISGLKSKYGVFGCLGNHDQFTGSHEKLARGFDELGFKLLRGRNEAIEVDGAVLNIIGVDYIGSNRVSALTNILGKLQLEGTTVLLLHAPYAFEQAASFGIDLTLSGHTHGGQIALTFGDLIITPARLSTMYLAGLFKIGRSHLYVNRGLGTTGPPIRINAPPEITHITLRAEA